MPNNDQGPLIVRPNQPREKVNWFISDDQFNKVYPTVIQNLAARNWTPLGIAKKASDFLAVTSGARILDIGSGVGKFCLAAAHYHPNASFFGIEQRKSLVRYADSAKDEMGIQNARFIHGNFTQLDLKEYDHFYFYNSFYENLTNSNKIDDSIDYSEELYNYYTRYLFYQLEQMPSDTRLVTFHSLEEEIPPDYHLVGWEMDNLLKYWIKI